MGSTKYNADALSFKISQHSGYKFHRRQSFVLEVRPRARHVAQEKKAALSLTFLSSLYLITSCGAFGFGQAKH